MNPLYPTRAPLKPTDTVARPNWRRISWALWLLVSLALLAIASYPIRFGLLRLTILIGFCILWLLSLSILWPSRPLRLTWIALSLVLGLFIIAPARPVDKTELQQSYVNSLHKYDGTTYVWGGETGRGLDCSGLVRRGFIDANRKLGLSTANPALVRSALDLWFYDSSAKAMGEEDRGRTRFLFTAKNLNDLKIYDRLQPGDIAVTQNGVHTLAYQGNRTWIEADPKEWKVIEVKAPSLNNWFSIRVNIVRWRELG